MHFEQARQLDAGLTDKAIAYLLGAGWQAARQSANQEAIRYCRPRPRYRPFLARDARTPAAGARSADRARRASVVHGYASAATRHVYERGLALARQLGVTQALFSFLAGLTRNVGVAGDQRTALQTAKELLAIAEAAQDVDMLVEAYRHVSGPSFALGRLSEARTFCEAGLALYDPAQHERLAYRFGHDPAVTYLNFLGATLWLLGFPEQALRQSERLLGLLQSLSHPTTLAYGYCSLATHACLHRDWEAAQHYGEEATRLGQAHGLPSWVAWSGVLRGWVLVEQGQVAEGLAKLKEGIAAWRTIGWAHFVPFFLALQAEACLKLHRLDEGLAALATARTVPQMGGTGTGQLRWTGYMGNYCSSPEMRAARRRASAAPWQRLANRGPGCWSYAAMSLARLQRRRGQAEDARQMLAGVCAAFTEGFSTADLQSAAALLESLERDRAALRRAPLASALTTTRIRSERRVRDVHRREQSPRTCYALWTMKVTKRSAIRMAKATKCSPASVVASRS